MLSFSSPSSETKKSTGKMSVRHQNCLRWGREGKEQMTSNCPELCSLQVKNPPKKCHSHTHLFFWSQHHQSNSPMALCSLPNVSVPFTFSCLWKCFTWHYEMTGKKIPQHYLLWYFDVLLNETICSGMFSNVVG